MTLYPTWQRYKKLWKQIIYPIIAKNIIVDYVDRTTGEESYEVCTTAYVGVDTLVDLSYQIKDALELAGYIVDSDRNGDVVGIIIQGKEYYLPTINISFYIRELEDDEILDGWDDCRWAINYDDPQDEFGFTPEYSKWIANHGIVDTYDNIRRAPIEVQESYCNYVRATDYTRLCVDIVYVEWRGIV